MLTLVLMMLCLTPGKSSVTRVKRVVRQGEARQGKQAGDGFMFDNNLQKLLQQQVSP